MTDIYRVKALWTGMPGAPGVSTHYLASAPSAADLTAVKTFYGSFASFLPSSLTISVPGFGDVIDDVSGELQNTWTATAPAAVVCASAAAYAAPVGGCVHWLTGSVIGGRRVKGTTFIVPLVNKFDTNGTLDNAWVTTMDTAAGTLITALGANLGVWHRPRFGPKPGPGIPRPRLSDGSFEGVSGHSVPDKVVVLRSRRD